MDPVVTKDERVAELKEKCGVILKEMDEKLTLHDFRVVFGETHTNLIFDVVVPHEFALADKEVIKILQEKIWEKIGRQYFIVVTIDKPAVKV